MPLSQEITFTTKKSHQALIRYPLMSDVPELTRFINTFSLENSFTRFNGEQMTLDEEQKYLASEIEAIEAGNAVKLFCFVGNTFAGVCDVHRDTSLLSRKLHGGILGLIIAKEFRGEGVGERLITETINQATQQIDGLKLIKLDCFATNAPALALYKKIGFKEVGRIPKALLFKNEYVDEVIMTLELGLF